MRDGILQLCRIYAQPGIGQSELLVYCIYKLFANIFVADNDFLPVPSFTNKLTCLNLI